MKFDKLCYLVLNELARPASLLSLPKAFDINKFKLNDVDRQIVNVIMDNPEGITAKEIGLKMGFKKNPQQRIQLTLRKLEGAAQADKGEETYLVKGDKVLTTKVAAIIAPKAKGKTVKGKGKVAGNRSNIENFVIDKMTVEPEKVFTRLELQKGLSDLYTNAGKRLSENDMEDLNMDLSVALSNLVSQKEIEKVGVGQFKLAEKGSYETSASGEVSGPEAGYTGTERRKFKPGDEVEGVHIPKDIGNKDYGVDFG